MNRLLCVVILSAAGASACCPSYGQAVLPEHAGMPSAVQRRMPRSGDWPDLFTEKNGSDSSYAVRSFCGPAHDHPSVSEFQPVRVVPPPLAEDKPKQGAEPIPTQWPVVKAEPIPTQWAALKVEPILQQKNAAGLKR